MTNLQTLEMKRGHQEKSSAGSAPAPVVFTTKHKGSAGTAPALVVTYTATHTHNPTDLIKRCYV